MAEPLAIALISDTHGHLDARVLQSLRDCHWVVHAGDIGGPTVLRALGFAERLIAVRGNNDTGARWGAQAASRLETLDSRQQVATPGGMLVVEHGDRVNPAGRRHELLRARYPKARAVVYGHSHRLVADVSARPWVLNPGAAGRSRTYGGPSCMILTVSETRWGLHALRFPPSAAARARSRRPRA